MSSTTWNGSSSTDWATGANWSTGSVPTTGAHVVIPDTSSINNCALDTTRTIGSLTIEANGTLVGGGNKLIIQSEGDASGGTEGFAVNNDGIISGNLDLEVNTPATTTCDFNGTSGNFKNVKINDVNVDATFHTDTTFDGTLIVAGGTLKPQGGSTIDVHGDVTISSGATFGVSTGTGTHRFGSLTVNGTHVATSGETIIDNERSNGRAVDIVGTFTHNTGTLSIQTAADTDLRWPSSSQAYNLRINNASCIARPTGDKPVIANRLSIDAGTFNTLEGGQNHALTVTGEVNIASGATLTCNSSVCSFGSLHSQGTANLADASGSTLITNEDGDGLSIIAGTFSNCVPSTIKHNNGTVTFNNHSDPAAHAAIVIGVSTSTDGLYNVIIDGANTIVDTYQPSGGSQHCTIFNDFTVTNGNFRVNSASNPFTVLGNVALNGGNMFNTSAAPTAAHSFGSLTIGSGTTFKATSDTTTITGEAGSGYAIEISGTYTPSGGTLKITTDANTLVKILDDVNHLIIEAATATRVYEWVNNTTVQGNLTINAGRFAHYSPNFSLDVQGDCTINNTGILDGGSGSIEMNSLTIGTGGEYRATTGTTTITGESGGGLAINNDGILTHNKGTVKVDMDSTTSLDLTGTGSVDFYNLIVDSDATVSYGASVIENNLTKKGAGRMRPNGDSGRNLEVKGTLLVEAGTFGRGANDTHTNTFGNVVITGGTIDLTGGGGSGKTIVKGAFRNLGGTVNSP